MYLENIFKSQDIQKACTKDFRDYEGVEKYWDTLMKNVNGSNPEVKKYSKKKNYLLDIIK